MEISLEFLEPQQFSSAFLSSISFLDVRAEVEFWNGAVPGAKNLPLLTTNERVMVGTCYRRSGQKAAVALGESLVSGSIREERICGWKSAIAAVKQSAVYCERGGLRSEIVQSWLKAHGIAVPRVRGGYKALRRFLLERLEILPGAISFIVVSGCTGSGKTRIIHALSGRYSRVLDFEALAHHRGSAFGGLSTPQPPQASFENALARALLLCAGLLCAGVSQEPCFAEDESQSIGRVRIPKQLFSKLQSSPLVVVESSLEERVETLVGEYVLPIFDEFKSAPAAMGFRLLRVRLCGDLLRLRKRLGNERTSNIEKLIDEAIAIQEKTGDTRAHRIWIEPLLRDYYDPFYQAHLTREKRRIVLRGTREEVLMFLIERSGAPAATYLQAIPGS